PTELMLQWNNGTWEHRAYWGADSISYGVNGTDSRRYMGALPAAGQWVRLEVPASQVGLANSTLKGMAFTAFNGRGTWDAAGKGTAGSSGGTTSGGTTGGGTTANAIWFEDALPAGALGFGDGGDTWNWMNSNPAPYAGTAAHQSVAASGLHQHYFVNASQT